MAVPVGGGVGGGGSFGFTITAGGSIQFTFGPITSGKAIEKLLFQLYAVDAETQLDCRSNISIYVHRAKPLPSFVGYDNGRLIFQSTVSYGSFSNTATLARDAGPTDFSIPIGILDFGERWIVVTMSAGDSGAIGYCSAVVVPLSVVDSRSPVLVKGTLQ